MIAVVIAGLILVGLALLPGVYVRRVMSRYQRPEDRYPGTGAELVRHMVERLDLDGVRVEETAQGDHYDPEARCVRLSPANYRGRSLTAVTVAAHEVGHAVQHHVGYPPLEWRTRLVRIAAVGQRIGSGLMLATPLVLAVTRLPGAMVITIGAGLAGLAMGVLVHLMTLPTEWDASFRRALPLLERGYLRAEDVPHARRILRAAALTYVAAALMSLLNIGFWLRTLVR